MKIIELLNKIANGEEMPKKIRYDERDMFWCEPCKIYEVAEVKEGELCGKDLYNILDNLNDQVEIIEEEVKPLTKQDIEALGYACGEIKKCFTNGWNKSLENKPFKEDKKIEKIDIKWDKDYYVLDEDNNKRYLNERDKIEMNKINEIIDYINNKD